MTLQEFFDSLSVNPVWIIAYFCLIPFTALLAWILGKDEGHVSPWKYLYSVLVYMICIPGVLAVGLNIYMFLFGDKNLLNADVYTRIFPVISMVVTLMLIKKNVSLDNVPGFGKLSGLMTMIFMTLASMWFLDRVRLVIFSYMPFRNLVFIFVGIFLVFKFGMRRFFNS